MFLSLRKISANPFLADAVNLVTESFSHNLIISQPATFALVPGMSESAHESLKSDISDPHNSLDTWVEASLISKTRHFGSLISLMKGPRVEHKFLDPQGEAMAHEIPPCGVLPCKW